MSERGAIRNREFAQKIRDFRGLRFGAITPTDIDAFCDFKNRLFVFIESKFGDSSPPYGQMLALERLCDACCADGRVAVVLLLKHQAKEGEDIDFAALPVTRYRLAGKWLYPKEPINCKQAIDKLLEEYAA